MSLLLKTGSVEVKIHALICRQVSMRPLFNDLPLVDDDDLIGQVIKNILQNGSGSEHGTIPRSWIYMGSIDISRLLRGA